MGMLESEDLQGLLASGAENNSESITIFEFHAFQVGCGGSGAMSKLSDSLPASAAT